MSLRSLRDGYERDIAFKAKLRSLPSAPSGTTGYTVAFTGGDNRRGDRMFYQHSLSRFVSRDWDSPPNEDYVLATWPTESEAQSWITNRCLENGRYTADYRIDRVT